jgi:hypothetical protein
MNVTLCLCITHPVLVIFFMLIHLYTAETFANLALHSGLHIKGFPMVPFGEHWQPLFQIWLPERKNWLPENRKKI